MTLQKPQIRAALALVMMIVGGGCSGEAADATLVDDVRSDKRAPLDRVFSEPVNSFATAGHHVTDERDVRAFVEGVKSAERSSKAACEGTRRLNLFSRLLILGTVSMCPDGKTAALLVWPEGSPSEQEEHYHLTVSPSAFLKYAPSRAPDALEPFDAVALRRASSAAWATRTDASSMKAARSLLEQVRASLDPKRPYLCTKGRDFVLVTSMEGRETGDGLRLCLTPGATPFAYNLASSDGVADVTDASWAEEALGTIE